MVGGEIVNRPDTDSSHCGVHATPNHVEHIFHAGGAVCGQSPEVRPPEQHGVSTEAEGLHDVRTTPDPAIHQDLDVAADGGGDLGQQLQLGWRICFSRLPTAEVLSDLLSFVDRQTKVFQARDEKLSIDAAQHLALATACQAMLSSNQFIYID